MHIIVKKGIDRLWLPVSALIMVWLLPRIGIALSAESQKQIEVAAVAFVVYALGHLVSRGVREAKSEDDSSGA